ncbi:unnamed protein product [Periconia digitata]|uniref:Uncharacterized protein n=1 Tax=Periconia digitata TaxID=1303443 RepID=A0A9W4U6I6_9PLEO|nr:unnamed protein product [Periconia digitata]
MCLLEMYWRIACLLCVRIGLLLIIALCDFVAVGGRLIRTGLTAVTVDFSSTAKVRGIV